MNNFIRYFKISSPVMLLILVNCATIVEPEPVYYVPAREPVYYMPPPGPDVVFVEPGPIFVGPGHPRWGYHVERWR